MKMVSYKPLQDSDWSQPLTPPVLSDALTFKVSKSFLKTFGGG